MQHWFKHSSELESLDKYCRVAWILWWNRVE